MSPTVVDEEEAEVATVSTNDWIDDYSEEREGVKTAP
ncbi:hypothetical protein NC653_037382 [Populus alba x Populus x berolinensis]|uniref:Uncharacterized protein n=1 Tax=Populus alba x Populus x berolinensis TaxID=444605 RepID=A0AAD6PS05_9ROSI|nr:hypothetical protein NC653_037382 [Populus alba x Populus x berolinensis]